MYGGCICGPPPFHSQPPASSWGRVAPNKGSRIKKQLKSSQFDFLCRRDLANIREKEQTPLPSLGIIQNEAFLHRICDSQQILG